MKKLILSFVIVMSLVVVASAQETAKKVPFINFAGGLIFSTNNSTSFVGFMGPKISVTFKVAEKIKVEFGFNGFPGLLLKPEIKPALALGSTLTLKKDSWKIKPVVGVTFVKTTKWQPMFGVGFVL